MSTVGVISYRQPVEGCYTLAIAGPVVLGGHMRRREFITLLGGTAVAWPGVADAQKAPIRIGFLAAGAAASANSAIQIDAIKRGLRENGLIEDQDYVLDARFPDGNYERFPELARRAGPSRFARDPCEYDRLCAGGAEPQPASGLSSCSRSMTRWEPVL